MIILNQEKVWGYNIQTIRVPLYLIVQLLEKREEYYDMEEDQGQKLSRSYLEKVYRLVGYCVIRLNDENSKTSLKFG